MCHPVFAEAEFERPSRRRIGPEGPESKDWNSIAAA